MTTHRKIQVTNKYELFTRHEGENRPVDLKKHRRLLDSMKRYGFLACFPIICYRSKKGDLVVKDGQHRLAIAQTLGLPVYWVEETVDFDVAVINSTPKIWCLRDYAEKHVANGLTDYQQGIDFAAKNGLPLGTAFALLAGNTAFGNIQDKFIEGAFTVRDPHWADLVASIYVPLVALSAALKSQRFIEACMAVCRVSLFEPSRLLASADRCRDKLASFSTRDAYLDMLESIYNFCKKQLVPLKVYATMAMRERNAATPKSKGQHANGAPKKHKETVAD